ncbi:MAG: class II aldolase [Rhizobiaceae bacterium]|nr:MAG: class II aldolase [Rhizobiaceae bacterium]
MTNEPELRRSLIQHCLAMNASGLNYGTAGNISVRCGDRMLITPSATPYDTLEPDDIAVIPVDRGYDAWEGPLEPSVEWRFHLDIMRSRPDVGAVVHAHAPFATILAIARKNIPACHYMIAAFGGSDIRCSGYARYGTKELSEEAIKALDGRQGCLLANHGMIAVGPDLQKALALAVELENLASQYYHSLLIGGPVLLTDEQIAETRAGFATYRKQKRRKEA